MPPVIERSASCALLRIASTVVAASCPSERSASPALLRIVWLSCSMRETMALPTDWPRTSICEATVSTRPTSSSWKRVMRVSSVVAISSARAPSVLSISSALECSVSASFVPRELIVPLASSIRFSSAPTTSLPPSASDLAISITRAPSASLSELMRPSSASPRRAMRSSMTVAASVVRAPTRLSKLSTCVRIASVTSSVRWLSRSTSSPP